MKVLDREESQILEGLLSVTSLTIVLQVHTFKHSTCTSIKYSVLQSVYILGTHVLRRNVLCKAISHYFLRFCCST